MAYAPARDVSSLRVYDVLEAVDNSVEGTKEEMCRVAMARRAEVAVDGIKHTAAQSEENKLILEISADEQSK